MLYHYNHEEILPDTLTNPPWHNLRLLPMQPPMAQTLFPKEGGVEHCSSGTPLLSSEVTVRKKWLKAKLPLWSPFVTCILLCISSKVMPIPEYLIFHLKDKVRITIAWSEALRQEIKSNFMDEYQKEHWCSYTHKGNYRKRWQNSVLLLTPDMILSISVPH